MRVHDYTNALMEIQKEGKDTLSLLENLKQVLAHRGHERLYPKILRDLYTSLSREEARRGITVTLSRETDEKKLEQEIQEVVKLLGGSAYVTAVDPTIIGGFVAEGGERRVDASYKKSLLALYRSLIA